MTIQEGIGKRIRSLREFNKLSQTELAIKVGYKDKTSIAKIEAGKVDLPQSKIFAFAKNLGTTPRTLQNYLKAESKTFRDALNKIRQKLAQHYIENTKMDLGTISFLLGYKEPSSFFRAYKKWNKKTPKQSS